jgi:hypothetical protein
MGRKLDKIATGNRIIEKCKNSPTMSIDVDGFWKKIKTVADFKEACEFCRVKPVYHE